MSRGLRKKLCGVLAAVLALAMFLAPAAGAASVGFNDILQAAMEIIQQSEGAYNSVNANDNGALSIGCIQWHGNRALSLLQTIVQKNPSQAQSILGSTLYNEITTTNSSGWSTRILNDDEAARIKSLLGTAESIQAQDDLIRADVSTYINRSMGYGITSPSALVYLADVENQCGAGGARRVIHAAADLVGGDYSAITLDVAHQAALADPAAGDFVSRREKVYNYAVMLNWDTASLLEGREIWQVDADTTLNVRSGPGTKYPVAASLSGGSKVLITSKVAVNGSTWGESSIGWLHLGYCSYVSGSVPSRLYFDPSGGSFSAGGASSTASYTNYNNGRPADALAIFTSAYGSGTGTNSYGCEVAVDASGRVIAYAGYGDGNMAIPEHGFVVSGIGAMFSWVYSIQVGDYIFLDPVEQTVSVYHSYEAYLSSGKGVTAGQAVGALPTPVRDGQVFDGWYTAPEGGTQVTADTIYTQHDCTVLYAHWRQLQNTLVSYDTDGGTVGGAFWQSIDGIDTGRGQDQLVVFTEGETTGTNVYGSEVIVEADGRVSAVTPYGVGNSTIPEGGFVLSGHNQMSFWLVQNIQVGNYVSYDAEKIVVCPSAETYAILGKRIREGDSVGVLPTASREHYTFTGWYLPDGTKATEATVVPAGGLTLTAGWERITANLHLDPGEGSLERIAKAERKASGMDVGRGENALVVYTPSYGAATGTNAYGAECVVDRNGQVVSAPEYGIGNTSIPVGCMVLSGHGESAWWLQANVQLGDYVAVGDGLQVMVYTPKEWAKTDTVQVCHGDPVGSLPIPVLADMEFAGWYTAEGVEITAETLSDFSGDVTLYARYTDPYSYLSFDVGAGAGGPQPVRFIEGESVRIPDTVPDGGCYSFLGWAVQPGGEIAYHPGDTYAGGSAVLYAVYEKEHGYTSSCSAVYTGLDESGNCLYTYTCAACGYTGTLSLEPEGVLTDMRIYETVNADFLTVHVSFEKAALLSVYDYTLQYDPASMTFHSATSNDKGTQVENEVRDGVGYVHIRLSQPADKATYIKLFFSGISAQEPHAQYITGAQQSGILPGGLPGAFRISSHTTVVGASVLGDVNGDGTSTLEDLVVLTYTAVGSMQAPYADIDGDGILTMLDVTYLQFILVSQITAVYQIP